MLEVSNLKKKFTRQDKNKRKQVFYAVNGVSFRADKGEIIGILGPNGAGKTTMLRMLAGIMEQTEGTIEIDGQNYKRNSLKANNMSLMVVNGSELIRYNPSTSSIEASNSRGFSWSMRYRCSDMGNIRALTLHKGEIILCSDKGIYVSKSQERHG